MEKDKLEALLLYIARLEYVDEGDILDEFDNGYLAALKDIRNKIKTL